MKKRHHLVLDSQVYIYIYIYMKREREREREVWQKRENVSGFDSISEDELIFS